MKSAPERTRTLNHTRATFRTPPSNKALEEMMAAFDRQSRELEAAFAAAAPFSDVQVAVRSELLEEIERACTTLKAPGVELFAMTRC